MLTPAFIAAFAVLSEVFFRGYEARMLAKTHVSSIRSTDYQRISLPLWLKVCTVGVSISVLMLYIIWQLPTIMLVFALSVFALFRLTRVRQNIRAARISIPSRLRQAIIHPDISNAQIAFHFSGADYDSASHYHMWEDHLKAVGAPLVLLLREYKHLIHERERASTHCLFFPKLTDIPQFAKSSAATLKAVFYANNGIKNMHAIQALPDAKHIQLLHGDSDKPPSFSPLTKMYDLIFVSGQMAIDRYIRNGVRIPIERFRIVGRPQVSAIHTNQSDPTSTRRQIVYMPTWRGLYKDSEFSSLNTAHTIIEKILDADDPTELHFKPHPLSYKDPMWPEFVKEIRKALNRKRANGNKGVFCNDTTSPFELYNIADILITDISSVMIDFLYSKKPILCVLPTEFSPDDYPSLAACYQVENSLGNLKSELDAAIINDPLYAKRAEIRDYSFGDFDLQPGVAFHKACLGVLNNSVDPI